MCGALHGVKGAAQGLREGKFPSRAGRFAGWTVGRPRRPSSTEAKSYLQRLQELAGRREGPTYLSDARLSRAADSSGVASAIVIDGRDSASAAAGINDGTAAGLAFGTLASLGFNVGGTLQGVRTRAGLLEAYGLTEQDLVGLQGNVAQERARKRARATGGNPGFGSGLELEEGLALW